MTRCAPSPVPAGNPVRPPLSAGREILLLCLGRLLLLGWLLVSRRRAHGGVREAALPGFLRIPAGSFCYATLRGGDLARQLRFAIMAAGYYRDFWRMMYLDEVEGPRTADAELAHRTHQREAWQRMRPAPIAAAPATPVALRYMRVAVAAPADARPLRAAGHAYRSAIPPPVKTFPTARAITRAHPIRPDR
ncbi:MAG: hypothetical protein R3D03_18020 [Geminicoccaceae bacterium]